MLENLFVIFAPGLGGNHLSNLISLTNRFNRAWNPALYQDGMTTAHASPITNLDIDGIDSLKNQSNVLCGHVGEYLWLQNKGLDQQFTNKKFLIVTFPGINTAAYSRLIEHCPYFTNNYFFQEQATLYTQQVLERLFVENDFFQISAEDIFKEDVSDIVRSIQHQLCTSINIDQAQQLHTTWYNSILPNQYFK